jgi:hypothetical protein
MAYGKRPGNDSPTVRLSSPSPSLCEKGAPTEAEKLSSIRSGVPATPAKQNGHNLGQVVSAKEKLVGPSKVMTTGEGVEYPTGIKLGLVTLALCLSVFLMALVRASSPFPQPPNSRDTVADISCRTTRLLRPLFPKSRISSTVCPMWGGTDRHTFSQQLLFNSS